MKRSECRIPCTDSELPNSSVHFYCLSINDNNQQVLFAHIHIVHGKTDPYLCMTEHYWLNRSYLF